jgi:hypothetical protein
MKPSNTIRTLNNTNRINIQVVDKGLLLKKETLLILSRTQIANVASGGQTVTVSGVVTCTTSITH